MIITFLTEVSTDKNYPSERHSILMDGDEVIGQREGMEPEDVCFGRDLSSPHEVEGMLQQIVVAVTNGKIVVFEHITRDWD